MVTGMATARLPTIQATATGMAMAMAMGRPATTEMATRPEALAAA
jgi:hypothetical protein